MLGAFANTLAFWTACAAALSNMQNIVAGDFEMGMKELVDFSLLVTTVTFYWLLYREIRRELPAAWNPVLHDEFRRLNSRLERHLGVCISIKASMEAPPASLDFRIDYERIRASLEDLGIVVPASDPYDHLVWTKYVDAMWDFSSRGDLRAARRKDLLERLKPRGIPRG